MARNNKKRIYLTPEEKLGSNIVNNQDAINRSRLGNMSNPFASSSYRFESGIGNKSLITDPQKESQSLVGGVFDKIKNIDLSDFANSARMFTEKLASQFVDEDLGKISEILQENEDLGYILEYKRLHQQLDQLSSDQSGNNLEYIKQITDRINELDKYFKGEGRQHDVISRLMYDKDNLNASDIVNINGMYATQKSREDDGGVSILGTISGIGDWLVTTLTQGLDSITGGLIGTDEGYKTKEVVKRLKEANYNQGDINYLMEKMYKGSSSNRKNVKNSIDENLVQSLIKDNEERMREKTIDLENDMDLTKNGKLKYYLPWFDKNLNFGKVYDPEDIPQQFRKDQEKYSGSSPWNFFAHPLYTLPEVASTVGLFKYQFGAMAGDAGLASILKLLAKRFPVFAVSDALLLAGSVGMGVGASILSRKGETALEAILGQQERALQMLQGSGIDIDSVFNQIRKYAKDTLKIKGVDQLDDQKLFELGIAYNVPINDDKYNQAIASSKKGIQKLINANNALALHDYLELLPFMSYGGSALKNMTKGALGNIYKHSPKLLTENVAKMKTVVGNFVGKVAEKVAIKDLPKLNLIAKHPKLGLGAKHIGQFAYNKAKLLGYEGVMEGLEEGAQELLQSRYKRGEFDDYNKPYSMFDTDELLQQPGLYKDAIMDYYGINPDDYDNASMNVRKAMNIGTASSVMFSSILGVFNNVRNDIRDHNTRQLIAQLKADGIIGDIVSSYAKAAQDHSHIGVFFDSFAKNNKSGAHIIKALSDFKKSLGKDFSIVKEEDIDADMRLANAAWFMYNNPFITQALEENGIEINSDQHKQLVIDGSTAIVDAVMNNEKVNELKKSIVEKTGANYKIVDQLFDESLPKEQRQKLAEENPHLNAMIDQFRNLFTVEKHKLDLQRQHSINEMFEDVKKKYPNFKNIEDSDPFAIWATELGIDKKLWKKNDTKKKYAEYLFNQAALNEFEKNMKDWKKFKYNSFIRQYVESKRKEDESLDAALRRFWNDETLKNDVIKEASKNVATGFVSEKEFVKRYMELFEFYTMKNKTKELIDKYENRIKLLEDMRRINGIDVDTSKLLGILTHLKKSYESLVSRENKLLNKNNKEDSENKELSPLDSLFGNAKIQFDNQKDIENDIIALQIDNAAQKPMTDIAQMYKLAAASPKAIAEAVFGPDAINDSEINEMISQFEKNLAKIKTPIDQSDDVVDFEEESAKSDNEKISKKAAWKFITKRIKDAEKRRLIARRNFEIETGIPVQDLPENELDLQQEDQEQNQENLDNKKRIVIPERKSDAQKKVEEDILGGKKQKDERTPEEFARDYVEKKKAKLDKEDEDVEDPIEEILKGGAEEEEEENPLVSSETNEDQATETPKVGEEGTLPLVQIPEIDDERDNNTETADDETNDNDGIAVDDEDAGNINETPDDEESSDNGEAFDDEESFDNGEAFDDEGDNDIYDTKGALDAEEKLNLWVVIENPLNLWFDEIDNQWYYGSLRLPEEQSKYLDYELRLLGLAETFGISYDDNQGADLVSHEKRQITISENDFYDLVGGTMFYNPNPNIDEKTGENLIVTMKVGDKDLKFDKPIASGRKLAKKLTIPGWLKRTKQYFVVSLSVKDDEVVGDIRDTLTVAMAIEDDENVYLTFLRDLRLVNKQVKRKNIDRNISKEEQEYLDKWYASHEHGVLINNETELRNWLETKGVDWELILGRDEYQAELAKNDGKIIVTKNLLQKYRKAVYEEAEQRARKTFYNTSINRAKDYDDTVVGRDGKTDFERAFLNWWKHDISKRGLSENEYLAKLKDLKFLKQDAINRARLHFQKPGQTAFTAELIQALIDNLRSFRNEIIEQYCEVKEKSGSITVKIPNKVKKTVIPVDVRQSNGRFDSTLNSNGSAIFRGLFDGSMSISQIDLLIESQLEIFGYGQGFFGNERYGIIDIFANKQLYLPGAKPSEKVWKGLSGKIYQMVKALGGIQDRIPMMLSEEKFDYQERIIDGQVEKVFVNTQRSRVAEDDKIERYSPFRLCLGMVDGKLTNIDKDGYMPSAAEVLLYMLCDQFGDMGGLDFEKRQKVVEFFIHHGTGTLLIEQPSYKMNPIPQFASKQLAFTDKYTPGKHMLWIAMPEEGNESTPVERRKYTLRNFSIKDIFGEGSELTRLSIVKAIATQMHWNTDKKHMSSKIGDSQDPVSIFIKHVFETYGQSSTTASILGCNQLSFEVSDFFDTTSGMYTPKESFSVLAWMLKNKKLTTDVSQDIFYAPFVFAGGVLNVNSAEKQMEETLGEESKIKTESGETVAFSLFNKELYDLLQNKFKGPFVATEDLMEDALESLKLINTKFASDNGGIVDRIVFAPPVTQTDGELYFNKKLEEFIKEYNSAKGTNLDIKDVEPITPLHKQNIKKHFGKGKAIVLLSIAKNGKMKITPKIYDGKFNEIVTTGVYSTRRSNGSMNVDATRQWLQNTLGIDERDIIISDSILRGCHDEYVFGATSVYSDVLTGNPRAYFYLSTKGGDGVAYHEAWHYISLLIHNSTERAAIYKSYLKSHKELLRKGVTLHDVEEAMAEDFRRYAEKMNQKGIIGKVRRFFDRMLKFLYYTSDKRRYMLVFLAIQQGRYKGAKLDESSVKQFEETYKKGILMIKGSLPGYSIEKTKKLDIDSYHDFYGAFRSVVNYLLLNLDITTKEDLLALNGKNFEYIIDAISGITDELDVDDNDRQINILKIFSARDEKTGKLINESVVRGLFNDTMIEFGAKSKVKKVKDVKSNEVQDEKIDVQDDLDPDNIEEQSEKNSYDQVKMTLSRKDNAAFRAKLFFRTIKQLVPDTYSGMIEYVEDLDDYGVTKLMNFNQVWQEVLDQLHQCTSFSKISKSQEQIAEIMKDPSNLGAIYDKKSMLGTAYRLSKSSALWHALYEKMINHFGEYTNNGEKNEVDTLLKSQIYSSIRSAKTRIQFVQLSNKRLPKFYEEYESLYEDDEGSVGVGFNYDQKVADRSRVMRLMNDNSFKVFRSVTNKWSKNAVSQGLTRYDSETSKTVISESYAKMLLEKLEKVKMLLKEANNPNAICSQALYNRDGIIDNVLQLLNILGIPADTETLFAFLSNFEDLTKKKKSVKQKVEENETDEYKRYVILLQKIFDSEVQGSISGIIKNINDCINSEVLKAPGRSRNDRELDKVLTNYPKDSQISLLATSYSVVHPSPSDYSVDGPNGERYYPITENSEVSSKTKALMDKASGLVLQMKSCPYSLASLILEAALNYNENDEETALELNTFVGMKDADRALGVNYFGMTPLEDYLSKMHITENGYLIFPTMADKVTYHTLTSRHIKENMIDELITVQIPQTYISQAAIEYYKTNIEEYDSEKYGNEGEYKNKIIDWRKSIRKSEDENDKKIYSEIVNNAEKLFAESLVVKQGYIGYKHLSGITIKRFSNYFLSELNSLIQYYSRAHIKWAVEDPNNLIENYHGSVKNGRMDFSGNGGKFRYFYDVITFGKGKNKINLNQKLQALFELQKKIESGKVVDKKSKTNDIHSKIPESSIADKDEEGKDLPFDGFELIRRELLSIRDKYFDIYGNAKKEFKEAMNKKLMDMVDDEIKTVSSKDSVYNLSTKNEDIASPEFVPEEMLKKYFEKMASPEVKIAYNSDEPYNKARQDLTNIAFYSLMTNFVLNQMMSTIEVEKVYSGDPAFYKWKANAYDKKSIVDYTYEIQYGGQKLSIKEQVEVENLDDTYSDKIKRLGGILSPGTEMRFDFSAYELEQESMKELFSHRYTMLNVEDIEIPSSNLREIYDNFKKLLVVDWIRCQFVKQKTDRESSRTDILENFVKDRLNDKFFKENPEKAKKLNDNEYVIDLLYSNEEFFNKFLSYIPKESMDQIKDMLEKQVNPYKKITVSDALVFIGPALYRKIKIGLGEWSFIEDDNGYSDEIAYNIIEKSVYNGRNLRDGEWLSNEKLYNIVKKFLVNALKMTYFQNLPEQLIYNQNIVKPIYNKMALFPLFKLHRSTDVGRVLYDRMNNDSLGRIDMIAFKSAVKVGAVKNGGVLVENMKVDHMEDDGTFVDKNKNEITEERISKALSNLNEQINLPSLKKINYETDEDTVDNESKETLPIKIQTLDNIRLQLNTHAHDTHERLLGTQMFKIAFENIIDDAIYGTGMSGVTPRKGEEIKADIMKCIDRLTDIGIHTIKQRFYTKNKKGDDVVDVKAVKDFALSVIRGNGVGLSAEDIIINGGVISGLVSRGVFEQSLASILTSEIVDIKTNGGTAIQLSVFGFAAMAHGKDSAFVGSAYTSEEDERMDLLIHTDLLSIGSFSVKAYLVFKTHEIFTIKDLIEKGKQLIDGKFVGKKIQTEIKDFLDEFNLSFDTKTEFEHKNLYREYNNGEELKWSAKDGSMEVLLTMNFFKKILPTELKHGPYTELRQWLVEHDIIKGVKKDGTMSNPKPFGIGYRIPTQGMSSMFGFIVADVLPELVGDLVIVPREFTAQTGSDFDVDKLYIATFSYDENGQRESILKGETPSVGAISNRLLQNYLMIISDRRNYGNARASIDVITDIIKGEIVNDVLRVAKPGYRVGMSQLLPSFQCDRKREFSVGKDGIGAFALNITNMALTQYVKLTFDYGDNQDYKFGDLYEISGQDGNRIADWLSAMVNAHVDVAKDAYIFDLNINKATYNHTNFLLRAGKGKKTFLFLAQPALKQYADAVNNSSGLYGRYIENSENSYDVDNLTKSRILKRIIKEYLEEFKSFYKSSKGELSKKLTEIAENIIYYYTRYLLPENDKGKKKGGEYEVEIPRIEKKIIIFDDKRAISSIKNKDTTDVSKRFEYLKFQLYALEAFYDMNPYAQAISDLVQCSKIDTKKFGNDIVKMYNYENNIRHFIANSTLFTIHDKDFLDSIPKDVDPKTGKETEASANKISQMALNKYFNDTFLGKKFFSTLLYQTDILDGNVFKASTVYKDIFVSVMQSFYGKWESEVLDENGNPSFNYVGYGRCFDEEKITKIGNIVEDIMRFNSLMANGYEYLVNSKDETCVDFTCGGDILAVIDKIGTLLIGKFRVDENDNIIQYKDLRSIFERLQNLINDIKNDPDPITNYGTIVTLDSLGKYVILNDLLLYLNPILPKEGEVGRMLLSESLTETYGDKKAKLTAAFSELLYHENKEVSNIARDLVLYAYFSTYDQNVRNSFFDIVPPEFRKQYDWSIKYSLKLLVKLSHKDKKKNSALDDELMNDYINLKIKIINMISGTHLEEGSINDTLRSATSRFVDVISRNFWYDEAYVPFYTGLSSKTSERSLMSDKNVDFYEYPDFISNNSSERFPRYFVTSKLGSHYLYAKISKNGEIVIYRRVGNIKLTTEDSTKRKMGIYVVVPKAGLRDKNHNLFELYCDYLTESLISTPISRDFALDSVMNSLNKIIEEENGKKDAAYKLVVEWDLEDVPYSMSTLNERQYIHVAGVEGAHLNGASIIVTNGATREVFKNSDVVIKIVQKDSDNSNSNETENKSKLVEINIESDNIENLIKLIEAIVEGNLQKGFSIGFISDAYDKLWQIPESEIQEELNSRVLEFESQLGQHTEEERNALIKNFKDDMIDKVKMDVTSKYLAEKLKALLYKLSCNFNIKGIRSSLYSSSTKLPIALAMIHSEMSSNYSDGFTRILIDSSINKLKSTRRKKKTIIQTLEEVLKQEVDNQLAKNDDIKNQEGEQNLAQDLKEEEFTTTPSHKDNASDTKELEGKEESNPLAMLFLMTESLKEDGENTTGQNETGKQEAKKESVAASALEFLSTETFKEDGDDVGDIIGESKDSNSHIDC